MNSLIAKIVLFFAIQSCASLESTPKSRDPMKTKKHGYSLNTIKAMESWQTVLPSGLTFLSPGHSNEPVRVYFNAIAAQGFEGKHPLPFKQGAMISKVFVSQDGQPTLTAKRIYFMRKEKPGYAPTMGDWSYGVARRRENGEYRFFRAGKMEECAVCHRLYPKQDHVLTVDRFRKFNGLWGKILLAFGYRD